MIIKAYDNGFGINLGDEFIHDNRKWVVTGFDLDKKDRIKYFYAADEELTEIAVFESYDENVMQFTGNNYKEVYALKKKMSDGELL